MTPKPAAECDHEYPVCYRCAKPSSPDSVLPDTTELREVAMDWLIRPERTVVLLAADELDRRDAECAQLSQQVAEIWDVAREYLPDAIGHNTLPEIMAGIARQRDGQHEMKDHLAMVARQLTYRAEKAEREVAAVQDSANHHYAEVTRLTAERDTLIEKNHNLVHAYLEKDGEPARLSAVNATIQAALDEIRWFMTDAHGQWVHEPEGTLGEIQHILSRLGSGRGARPVSPTPQEPTEEPHIYNCQTTKGVIQFKHPGPVESCPACGEPTEEPTE